MEDSSSIIPHLCLNCNSCRRIISSHGGFKLHSKKNKQNLNCKAARIVTQSKKSNHITPVLQSLHWLPVEKRIAFKIGCHCFKCIHGTAPDYLTSLVSISIQIAHSFHCLLCLCTSRFPNPTFHDMLFYFLPRLCGMPFQKTPDAVTPCLLLKAV